MLSLLLAPVVVLLLVAISQMREMRRHDTVLFQFCEIRRSLMKLLRDEGPTMDYGDYAFARGMLQALNSTIHHYKEHKSRMFNVRQFYLLVKQYRASAEALAEMPTTCNDKLRDLQFEFGKTVFFGFLTFTPFYRAELTLRTLIYGAYLLRRVGVERMAYRIGQLQGALTAWRRQSEQFGTPFRMA